MADFEQLVKDAVTVQDIPGCALVSTNRDGSFRYAKAFGSTSMKEANAKPLGLDTVMWIASCTKLMTSISAIQLVERGLVGLDEPVYKHIPELESFKILSGFEESSGKPIIKENNTPITLRHLLTHTSGLAYDFTSPSIIKFHAFHGRKPSASGKLLERFSSPLIFEPGTSWAYGPGIDYAGLLVERVSGKTLEEYMKANLWEPLGIKDMTFHLSSRPDLQARFADMSARGPDGRVHYTDAHMAYHDSEGKPATDCMGGQGVFTSAEEYLKILHGLLTTEENGKILKKETVELFFKPNLGEGSKKGIEASLEDESWNNAMGGAPRSIKKDWGLGGVLILGDLDDGKQSGTMLWGGLPNLIWWVDRKAGLCGLYAGQVVPPGDAVCAALNRKFEAEMYRQYAASKKA
ncbi:beta-lactamase/transpeptidase-like protein [Paraphoma chrysanthemicola]|uniref:Beta-lactamase/transpeptidase-like protein n=1 Tax=Paraphoma chrysanthemicola TaxID=798071 RepID=A0A8K0VYG8_9PLEO|nr:beta-lactamase/transpeptidase-like protein [Paraphoma chrysanthemicola]